VDILIISILFLTAKMHKLNISFENIIVEYREFSLKHDAEFKDRQYVDKVTGQIGYEGTL